MGETLLRGHVRLRLARLALADERAASMLEYLGIGAAVVALMGLIIALFGGSVGQNIANAVGGVIQGWISRLGR